MKKNVYFILIAIILLGLFSPIYKIKAQTPPPLDPDGTCTLPNGNTLTDKQNDCASNKGSWIGPYSFLAPLPCADTSIGGCTDKGLTTFDTATTSNLGTYLNVMIRIFIGLCAVLSVVMIVMGGIEYMTSELVSSKEAGKERIRGAIFGLLLALGAYALLFTINPDILNTDLSSLANVTVDVPLGGESSAPFGTGIAASTLKSAGIVCPDSLGGSSSLSDIATSFQGKVTYSQTSRNTTNADGTVNMDCSSFVDQVYTCAGLPPPGNTTAQIFSSGNATPLKPGDLSSLRPGDLIGWTAGQNGQSSGHVLMYIGNGQVIDSQANTGANKSVTARPLDAAMQARITSIKRI
jgi:cell wall-associated NlpC family hydrolase